MNSHSPTPRGSALALLVLLVCAGCAPQQEPAASPPTPTGQSEASLALTTGPMLASRSRFSATRLANGKVLVAGGMNTIEPLSSAELYDPATRTWSATGALTDGPRMEHVAVRLADGGVLVTGGRNNAGHQGQTLLYNVANGIWYTPNYLLTPRVSHTATLLPDGRVLVTGGTDRGYSRLASCELFDPATWTWTSAAPMNEARDNHSATLLANGKVLVAGGNASGTAELYDPATNTWSYTGGLATPRQRQVALLLADGRVLVTGGKHATTASRLGTAELYDPAAGTWSAAGSLSQARDSHTGVVLPSGKVAVFGGYTSGGYYTESIERFDPATRTWSSAGAMLKPRGYHGSALLENGYVLLAGGASIADGNGSAELYTESTCVPVTCASQGKTCGPLPDGCGNTLHCGTCASGQMCSASNVCIAVAGAPAYDATRKAPRCTQAGATCDSGALLNGRGPLGPEANAPNTLQSSCADGTTGTYRVEPSLERLRVTSVDGSPLTAGKQVRVEATVWAYVPTVERLDLFAAPQADSPVWTYLTTLSQSGVGSQTLSTTYTLPSGGTLQALRGVFRSGGTVGTCTTLSTNDHDDLVFPVAAAPPPPPGNMATYDGSRRAPGCSTVNQASCDSGSLLQGRGPLGPESNAPNTLLGSCQDGTSGSYHADESLDRLKVSTVDGSPLAAGRTVRIEATVWAWGSGGSDALDLYTTANASSPSWTYLTTLVPPGGGAQVLSTTYTLPSGALQAVRGVFRYGGSPSSCAPSGYTDHDDLFFTVQ